MPLALCFLLAPAAAQTPRAQAEKELARRVPAGSVQACSLIARADVKKATGIDPYVDAEPAGQGGWICSIGTTELKVYSGGAHAGAVGRRAERKVRRVDASCAGITDEVGPFAAALTPR